MAQSGFTLRLTGQGSEEREALARLLETQLRSRGYGVSVSAEEGDAGVYRIEAAPAAPSSHGEVTPQRDGACVEVHIVGSPQAAAAEGAQAESASSDEKGAGVETPASRVVVHAGGEDRELSAARVMAALEESQLLARPEATGYTQEDEEEVRRRLEALGYV